MKDYAYNELRYKVLTMTNPVTAEHLIKHAQELVNLKWKTYEELATKKSKRFCAGSLSIKGLKYSSCISHYKF